MIISIMFRPIARANLRRFLPKFLIYIVWGILLFYGSGTLIHAANPLPFLTSPQAEQFPRQIANPIRRDLARRLNLPRQQLSIASSTIETWEDDCLGLKAPGELCIQLPIEGWRVEVTNGHRNWFYRADRAGQNIRLESEVGVVSLPPQVGDRILATSAEQLGIPASQLNIAQSQQYWQTCPSLAIACSDLPGWRVIVVDNRTDNPQISSSGVGSLAPAPSFWVYHANDSGSEIYLDEAVSQQTSLVPTFLPTYRNPAKLGASVVFRAVASGGFTRQTYETILREDGQIWRSLLKPGASLSQFQSHQISLQQVEAFQQLLKQQQFSDFNGLNYVGRNAESITITLMSKDGMTQYESTVEAQLPSALLGIVRAWDQMVG
ncbi:MAG: hypothetical protein KME11_07750 [Timaviella obliquedivisa GSE-PSE-MK23-08B]|jgi:hypothetical protein|nr:hypothetical protein [Timaviella obliquedivisa GSE-PSE-MK23-08B]